jgi:hypothetical protein
MAHVWWCSTTLSSCSSGVLEQRVSGTLGRTRWTNSMACPSLALSPLHFYLSYLQSTVDAAAVSDVQDLQQWTKNGFEMIRTTTGIVQRVRRSLFRRALLRWSWRWTLRIFFNLQDALTRKPCFRRPIFINRLFLVLWCRFSFCGFSRVLFVNPVQSVRYLSADKQ